MVVGEGRKNCPGKQKSSSVNKLGRSALEILHECCAKTENDERKKFRPLGGVGGGFETGFKLTVKTLNHSIGTWVVCSCAYPFGSEKVHKGSEKG